MELSWVYYNNAIVSQGGKLHSDTASLRYRLLIPVRELHALGHEINLVNIMPGTALDQVPGDVLVLSKLLAPSTDLFAAQSASTLRLVRAAKARGQVVVADICDHHFDHPTFGRHFRELVAEASVIVASTATMQAIVRQYTGQPVLVIGDSYEGDRHPAKFDPPPPRAVHLVSRMIGEMLKPQRPLDILWFGHASNLNTLVGVVPELVRLTERYRLRVHVVTAEASGAAQLCDELGEAYAPRCTFRFSAWSGDVTQRALRDCDLVIIPSGADDMAKAVKSSNRMIESLWAGRYVAAHAVPSYEDFGAYSYVGTDIVQGIEAAIAEPKRTVRRITAAQDYIAERYSPAAIGRLWENALAGATARCA